MTKRESVEHVTLSHQALKDKGNRYFTLSQFSDAVHYYSLAIAKESSISSYFSNRALAYVQLQEYAKALPDCKSAIELDASNLKAYFFAGQAHIGLAQYDEALSKLMHAHNLALEQHRHFGDTITSVIRYARRKRFESAEEKRIQEENELQTFIKNLILKDAESQKQALLATIQPPSSQLEATKLSAADQSSCNLSQQLTDIEISAASETSKTVYDPPTYQDAQKITTSSVEVHVEHEPDLLSVNLTSDQQERLAQIQNFAQQRITEVDKIFEQVDERRRKREVPEFLCDRISFEPMQDPVVTPGGVSYDRPSIVAHLRQVGHFDPLSRQPLTENQLIPNLSLKEVVRVFLDENPWAEGY